MHWCQIKNQAGEKVHAYNYTWRGTMGFSSYYLMCSHELILPIDLYFGTQAADMNNITSTKFIAAVVRDSGALQNSTTGC